MNVAGTNVRTVRQALGMSLRALAEAAGLDPATLSRIENGKQNLTEDLAEKLARAMHVSRGMLFADPGILETSMFHTRKAPLLTAPQLLQWSGPDGFEESPEQTYLRTGLEVGSRHMFGYEIADEANAPEIRKGDVLLFDAKRTPRHGEFVLGQNKAGIVTIGRLRLLAHQESSSSFDIVPLDRFFPVVSPSKDHMIVIRGVRAELRRYSKPE